MINTILAVDSNDTDLGDFFKECGEDLTTHFNSVKKDIKVLDSPKLNSLTIKVTLENLNKFIFLAYSHGSDDELLANGITPFINSENASEFNNSFFYTCSCNTAKTLGNILIKEGCISYIGYKNKFGVWDFNRAPFIECANLGIKLFLSGEQSEDIVVKMQKKYTEHIDNYNNDVFGAAILLSNRRALRHLGKNINIEELN